MKIPHRPTVIAFCSPVMGSGKSAAAQHLVSEHGFRLVKFAGPLKMMTRALLHNLVRSDDLNEYIEGSLKTEPLPGFADLTPRHIMQTLGTEWGRDVIGTNFWADITRQACLAHLNVGRSVVIDDMRFPNEWDTVRSIGGLTYRIVRPDAPPPPTNHSSEGGLDNVAMPEIWNRQDLPRLYEKLDLIIRESL